MIVDNEAAQAFEQVRMLKRAYQLSLTTPFGQEVLQDLAKFCYAGRVAWHENERRHMMRIGQQAVWFRIQNFLELPAQDLFAIYTGRPFVSKPIPDEEIF